MSRTVKDMPAHVRARRTQLPHAEHFGCVNDPDPGPWRRSRTRDVVETTLPAAWYRRDRAVTRFVSEPLVDVDGTWAGWAEDVITKTVTEWVFGPRTSIAETVTVSARECRIDHPDAKTWCRYKRRPWAEMGLVRRSGLWRSRRSRADGRDQLRALLVEYNTHGCVDDGDVVPVAVSCRGRCRRGWCCT